MGSTKALKPVGATCTTQRPVSMARSRDEAICWVCTIVPVYVDPLVGLSSSWPPWLHRVAGAAAEEDLPGDHHAEPARPAVSQHGGTGAGDGVAVGQRVRRATCASSDRNGTYSPNGTRWTLS